MTENTKLKQVIDKINGAIKRIEEQKCVIANSLNVELDSNSDNIIIYLQTPNNLIIPSLILNDQAYDFVLKQDDDSNAEGMAVSLAGSFFDATDPKDLSGLDQTQLRQDMDYLYNVWYKFIAKSEAVNNYYKDENNPTTLEIQKYFQSHLNTDLFGQIKKQMAKPYAYLLAVYKEAHRLANQEKAGQLIYHLLVEVPSDTYLFKPDSNFSLLNVDSTGNDKDEAIDQQEAEKVIEKMQQAEAVLVKNNIIPADALGMEYYESQHDLIVYLQSPNDVMIFRNDIIGKKIANLIEQETLQQCAAQLATAFVLNFARDLQDTAGQIRQEDWQKYCSDLDYLYRLILGFSFCIPDVDSYLANNNKRSISDLRQKLGSYIQQSDSEDKAEIISIINKVGYSYLYSLMAYIDSIGDDQDANTIAGFLGHALVYIPNQEIDANFIPDKNFSVLDEDNPHNTWQNGSVIIDSNQGHGSKILADLYQKLQVAATNLSKRCNFIPGSINVQYSTEYDLLGLLFQTPGQILSPSFAMNIQQAAQLVEMESMQLENQLALDYVIGAFGENLDDLTQEIHKNPATLDADSQKRINIDLAYNFERITKLSNIYPDMNSILKETMGDDYSERKMHDFLTTAMKVDDNNAAYQADGLLIRATYTQVFALYRLMHDSKILDTKATTLVNFLQYQPAHPIVFDAVKDIDLFADDNEEKNND